MPWHRLRRLFGWPETPAAARPRRRNSGPDIAPTATPLYAHRAGAYGPHTTTRPAGVSDRTELQTGVAPMLTRGQQNRAAGGDR